MSLNIKVDTRAFDVKIKKFEQETKKQLANELNRFAILSVSDAKRDCPVDEGFLRNSISFNSATPEKLGVSVVAASNYAAYVEFGTGQFAALYVPSLPPDFQAYARQFFVNGKGRLPARPFLIPSVLRNLDKLKERLK